MRALSRFPVLVVLALVASAMMLVPALHAAQAGVWNVARSFFYHSVLCAALSVIVGIALMNHVPRRPGRYLLLTLLMAYALLPLMLAAPLLPVVGGLSLGGAYFEMVSSLTTTGATLFDSPRLLPDSVHLWRSIVGWAGGFLILVSAIAVFAPLNLGGFEISQEEAGDSSVRGFASMQDALEGIGRAVRLIAPAYAVLTLALALLLILAGARPFVAACHAMAILSTSGISPVGGLEGAPVGRVGEMAMVLFLLLAVTHRGGPFDPGRRNRPSLRDPQIQLMLISVLSVTVLLFMRSFLGAVDIERQDNLASAGQALWGSFFTALSYITTTGFESSDWRAMQIWSGLPDPGALLLGLAMMGGGIATTAGGIKLLRLYALYRHGLREMDQLVYPSGVLRRGSGAQLISEHGPRIAFVFLMLFLVAVAVLMILLSALGHSFQTSLALAIASLNTTGPAIGTLGGEVSYAGLGGAAQGILATAMIVGRMELLAIIALLNPAYWQR